MSTQGFLTGGQFLGENTCDFKQDLRMQSICDCSGILKERLSELVEKQARSLITLSPPAGVHASLPASGVGCSCGLEESPLHISVSSPP